MQISDKQVGFYTVRHPWISCFCVTAQRRNAVFHGLTAHMRYTQKLQGAGVGQKDSRQWRAPHAAMVGSGVRH